MYIENIWGVMFCIYIPTLLIIYGAYEAGIKEGKRRYKKHKKAGDYKNGGKYRRTKNFNK